MVHSTANAVQYDLIGSRFYNAGYPSAGAGNRNFDLATSGHVTMIGCDIGRDDATADAAFFITAAGTGELVLIGCRYSAMAPPTGYAQGAQATLEAIGGIGGRYRSYYGIAAPAAGTWAVGDQIVNSVPSVGSPKGWRCTVAGTPGTWVSEGNL